MELVHGWRRMQGIVYRSGDARFEGRPIEEAVRAALADPDCLMVNRNQGAGTRILIDQLLGGTRPMAIGISPARTMRWPRRGARACGLGRHHRAGGASAALGFIPLNEEHYDFALISARKERPAVQAFLQARFAIGRGASSAGF